ncbi:hypothetical protein CFOL_v3_04083 [Cephalotus follicularis]|uniref:CTLH domain-containing protein n=1 Tax=Cephalotus follicularis TaxID=3775 RepID=A0A1Q3AYC3_CEPFO|nr:hypothetical protein CFOL_v3_04083 [Cephalotus follicularis]
MILKFLKDENFHETAHTLEREAGLFFDMNHFENMVYKGQWDAAEKYFSGFASLHENMQSTRTYFELRKQKFLDALDRKDRAKAVNIIMNEFKVFLPYNENLCQEATMLLSVDDFRKCKSFSMYGDAATERRYMMNNLKSVFFSNPVLKNKMQTPTSNRSSSLKNFFKIGSDHVGTSYASTSVAPPYKK